MWKVVMFRIDPYSVEEGSGFFRNQVSPVKALAVFAAYQFEFLAVDELILTVIVKESEYEFDPYIIPGYIFDIESNLCTVVMAGVIMAFCR